MDHDIMVGGIIISCGIGLFLIFYIFSDFTYKISDNVLKAKWKILKFITFKVMKIKLENIQDVRRPGFKDSLSFKYGFGNFIGDEVILILKKRYLLWKKICITPKDPEAFIKEINETIQLIQKGKEEL